MSWYGPPWFSSDISVAYNMLFLCISCCLWWFVYCYFMPFLADSVPLLLTWANDWRLDFTVCSISVPFLYIYAHCQELLLKHWKIIIFYANSTAWYGTVSSILCRHCFVSTKSVNRSHGSDWLNLPSPAVQNPDENTTPRYTKSQFKKFLQHWS